MLESRRFQFRLKILYFFSCLSLMMARVEWIVNSKSQVNFFKFRLGSRKMEKKLIVALSVLKKFSQRRLLGLQKHFRVRLKVLEDR